MKNTESYSTFLSQRITVRAKWINESIRLFDLNPLRLLAIGRFKESCFHINKPINNRMSVSENEALYNLTYLLSTSLAQKIKDKGESKGLGMGVVSSMIFDSTPSGRYRLKYILDGNSSFNYKYKDNILNFLEIDSLESIFDESVSKYIETFSKGGKVQDSSPRPMVSQRVTRGIKTYKLNPITLSEVGSYLNTDFTDISRPEYYGTDFRSMIESLIINIQSELVSIIESTCITRKISIHQFGIRVFNGTMSYRLDAAKIGEYVFTSESLMKIASFINVPVESLRVKLREKAIEKYLAMKDDVNDFYDNPVSDEEFDKDYREVVGQEPEYKKEVDWKEVNKEVEVINKKVTKLHKDICNSKPLQEIAESGLESGGKSMSLTDMHTGEEMTDSNQEINNAIKKIVEAREEIAKEERKNAIPLTDFMSEEEIANSFIFSRKPQQVLLSDKGDTQIEPLTIDCINPKKKLKARAKELKSLIHQKEREVLVLKNELNLVKFDLK